MVNHASGREIWNVLVQLARTAGFAVLPVEDALADLPGGVPEPIRLLTSGDELLGAVESG